MKKIPHLLAVLSVAFLAAGCAQEPAGPNFLPPPGTPGPGPDTGCGEECPPDAGPDPIDLTEWEFHHINGVANVDDDDASGEIDWNEGPSSFENDLSTLTLHELALDNLADGDQVRLFLPDNNQAVRVYIDDLQVLGSGVLGAHEFTPGAGDVLIDIEFAEFNSTAEMTIEWIDATGTTIEGFTAFLNTSPVIINHHLQPAEHVWMLEVNAEGYENSALVEAYSSVLGSAFTPVPGADYDWDVWMQDEIEFATTTGDQGQRLDVVIDSIRDRGLAPFSSDYLIEPDTMAAVWGDPAQATSFDSFGNLEASPPVTVDGITYPFGRIYYGDDGTWGLNATLASFLDEQQIQAPFALDTAWLCVGHVDEYSTFVPDPSSAKGFKLLLSDVSAAYDLLDSLDPTTPLPLYELDYGYATVGDLVADTYLRALNEDLQTDQLNTIRERFKTNLGLTDDDIILVPTLFEEVSRCGGAVAALMPGTVNLIVANDASGDTHLFIPDPFFRTDLDDQVGDPLIEDLASKLPASLNAHFVDNWNVYHLGLGEIHCGTNVRRTPLENWWDAGIHLLGGI
jgi:hypothetical protein